MDKNSGSRVMARRLVQIDALISCKNEEYIRWALAREKVVGFFYQMCHASSSFRVFTCKSRLSA